MSQHQYLAISHSYSSFQQKTSKIIIYLRKITRIDWDSASSIEKGYPNYSFNMFDIQIIKLMDKYILLKN